MGEGAQAAIKSWPCASHMFNQFNQLQQQWTQATNNLQHAIQESAAAKQIQETATRPCIVCQQRFLRTNVFTCGECKQLACRGCFTRIHMYNPSGECTLSSPGKQVQVCKNCGPAVQERIRVENVQERVKRVHAFLDGCLEPYKYSAESKLEQSLRLGNKVMEGVQQVAGFLPLGDAAKAINAGAYIVRYGPLVLFGNEVIMALQLLVSLSKRLDVPAVARSAPQDLFGGLYYMMGEHCGERGKAPELERLEHVDSGGVAPVPSQELLLQLRRLVRVLYVATYTEPTPTDAQRLFRQVLPGSELVLAELSEYTEVPSYYLACTRRDRKAYLVLPGTRNIPDIVTDVNAEAESVPGGLAHRGMVRSAKWLLGEVGPTLELLYTKGYSVVVIGHSLGAAVASLLTVFLRPQIPSIKTYCYGTPACVDWQLMGVLLDCVVSVVNRDDVVPRLNVQNVQALAESALCAGQRAKTNAWMDEDWRALKDVERVAELRRRGAGAAAASQQPLSSGPASAEEEKILRLCAAGVSREAAVRALEKESGDLNRALLRATEEEAAATAAPANPTEPPCRAPAEPTPQPQPQQRQAAPAMGPWAFPGTSGVWGELQKLSTAATAAFNPTSRMPGAAASSAAPAATAAPGASALEAARQGEAVAGGAPGGALEVAVPGSGDLPRFFIPGQVVHLYKENGLSRAAQAACTHEALTRIHPTPRMMEDHTVKAYDEALRQACIGKPKTPRWESTEERKVCACCEADFNWAYVLKSEPQRMLARLHCFSCGKVVCNGCSQNRRSQEQLGFVVPVRTCDTCFYSPDRDP